MVKSFQNVEPIPPPQHSDEDLFGQQVPPTLSREIPFKVIDRADKEPDQFESIAHLFRHRANLTRLSAFSQVDNRGKESILTWEKLSTRAEKVAHVLVDKSGLVPGDRVGLFYKTFEILDFIVALFGCFLAGLVAVPIQTDDLTELWFILRVTQTHLVLTTDTQLKTLTKQLKAKSLDFPKDVEWWPTHDFGSLYTHQIKIGHYSSIRPCHLAYIEFTKSMNGELKGCAVSHLAIMHTCHTFVASTTDTVETQGAILPNWDSQGDTILSSIESRQQLGLIVLLTSVYNASHTLFTCSSIMETPQVWVYLVSKYKATMGLLNYSGLNSLIRQQKDMQFNKKIPPDLSSLRLLLIDSLHIQPHSELLEPFGLAQGVITPIASLPTHAGLILAFRDFLGSEKSREMWECTLNRNALKEGRIVLANEGYRATSHGFPFAQSSVVIVDPETTLVCPANKMGEIWISSQGAPDLFWGIPSESALKASAQWVTENTVEILPGFVRTGLLGTLIGGRLIVLSKFEECVRQGDQIFFGHDLINTLKRKCQLNAW